MAESDQYRDHELSLQRTHRMRVLAEDPSIGDGPGGAIMTTVEVPVSWLAPGPRTHRFFVIDYDATERRLRKPIDLTVGALDSGDRLAGFRYEDRFADLSYEAIRADPELFDRFLAQNTFAIAARTLARFEEALGRRHPWAFSRHSLYLVPRAFEAANAYYSRDDGALYFGYLVVEGEAVFTGLSHDVVAHETTHAILDGLKPGYNEPGLPDQAAFHEAFADIVALMSLLETEDVVATLLRASGYPERVPEALLGEDELRSHVLLTLAGQLGKALYGEHRHGLRQSLELEVPESGWRNDRRFDEPHLRGEILVAAVSRVFLDIWLGRVQPIARRAPDNSVDLEVVVEQATKAAAHVLKMCIRGLDYAPPIELQFEDFLDAVVIADEVAAPRDRHRYRAVFAKRFAEYGILPDANRRSQLLRTLPGFDRPAPFFTYHNLRFAELQQSPDEAYAFIWDNAEELGIARDFYLNVGSVRPSSRIGADGFIVRETVVDYTQRIRGTVEQARSLGIEVDIIDPETGRRLGGGTEVELWGGGTLVFGEFGRLRYHSRKPLQDWKRQRERLDYLVRNGLRDSSGRYGFSFGYSHGQQFAEMHNPRRRSSELW